MTNKHDKNQQRLKNLDSKKQNYYQLKINKCEPKMTSKVKLCIINLRLFLTHQGQRIRDYCITSKRNQILKNVFYLHYTLFLFFDVFHFLKKKVEKISLYVHCNLSLVIPYQRILNQCKVNTSIFHSFTRQTNINCTSKTVSL